MFYKGTATASNSGVNEPLTLEKLAAAKKAIDDLGPDPLEQVKEWMRAKGFAPEDGGVLVLPEPDFAMCGFGAGLRAPDFVRSSKLVSQPVLINPRKALAF